jgi:hypothetical protein
MHEIAGAEQTGQRAPHGGLVEDPLYLRYPGQDVVSGIAFLFEHGLDLAIEILVKLLGQAGVNLDISVRNELADVIIPKQMGVSVGHSGPFGVTFEIGAIPFITPEWEHITI